MRETVERHAFVVRPYARMLELEHVPNAIARVSVSSMEAQAILVLSGFYLSYLPEHCAKAWVLRGEMRSLSPSIPARTELHGDAKWRSECLHCFSLPSGSSNPPCDRQADERAFSENSVAGPPDRALAVRGLFFFGFAGFWLRRSVWGHASTDVRRPPENV